MRCTHCEYATGTCGDQLESERLTLAGPKRYVNQITSYKENQAPGACHTLQVEFGAAPRAALTAGGVARPEEVQRVEAYMFHPRM